MATRARSTEHDEHGTRGGTQGHITSRLGAVPRTVRGGVPVGDGLRKLRLRVEGVDDRSFIGSMCVCGQHPRVWAIRQFLKAWEMGR